MRPTPPMAAPTMQGSELWARAQAEPWPWRRHHPKKPRPFAFPGFSSPLLLTVVVSRRRKKPASSVVGGGDDLAILRRRQDAVPDRGGAAGGDGGCDLRRGGRGGGACQGRGCRGRGGRDNVVVDGCVGEEELGEEEEEQYTEDDRPAPPTTKTSSDDKDKEEEEEPPPLKPVLGKQRYGLLDDAVFSKSYFPDKEPEQNRSKSNLAGRKASNLVFLDVGSGRGEEEEGGERDGDRYQ